MILSSLLSDGMVLQRHAEVPIWGRTEANREVRVSFMGEEYRTQADEHGWWRITLKDLPAGGPHEMVITADEERVIRDILIGDVWVLGGQSNMELPVNRTLDLLADDVRTIDLPQVRHFTVPMVYNFHGPQEEVTGGKWYAATPDQLLDFSAVGMFFARALYQQYQVPIGLIRTAIGGTPIEAWMSEQSLLAHDLRYASEIQQCRDDNYIASVQKRDQERNHEWYTALNQGDIGRAEGWHEAELDTGDWQRFIVPNRWEGELEHVHGAVWFRKEFELPASMAGSEAKLKLGTIVDADDTYVNGVHVGSTAYQYPPRRYTIPEGVLKEGKNTIAVRVISTHNRGEFIKDMPYKIIANGQELELTGEWRWRIGKVMPQLEPQTFFQYKPTGLFNGMIAPLRHYRIRGVLWYQGESNTHTPEGYRDLFAAMVQDWRGNWQIEDLPVIYAQLPNFGYSAVIQPDSLWARFRQEQLKCLSVPHTAMAITIDAGEYNDIHPQDKRTVGERMALCARKLVYGEDLVYSGPIYAGMEREGSALRIKFDHVGSGLTARGGKLGGFAVCGTDGVFHPAEAVIDGDTVVVTHDEIKEPVHVRYAWADNPLEANLYNREGLPASPFTTEE